MVTKKPLKSFIFPFTINNHVLKTVYLTANSELTSRKDFTLDLYFHCKFGLKLDLMVIIKKCFQAYSSCSWMVRA